MSPGVIVGIVGAVVGVLGGAVGTYFGIQNTRGPKERAFMVRCAIYGWIGVGVFVGLLCLLPHPHRWYLLVPYAIILPNAIIKSNKIQAQIRAEEAKGRRKPKRKKPGR